MPMKTNKDKKLFKFDKPYLIAEIGVNHNGIENYAFLMTELAIKAGADAVKFQLFSPEKLVSKTAEMAQYQKINTGKTISQQQMLEFLKIDTNVLIECRNECRKNNVDFVCTAFDEESLLKVISLDPAFLKWPSGEINNFPLLKIGAESGLPILISTGMCDAEEIQNALNLCFSHGMPSNNIALLHCISQYPTPVEKINLRSVKFLEDKFDLPVGLSDHTLGTKAAELAVAMGVSLIEKHVTLSRLCDGPDHKASMNFDEFAEFRILLDNTIKILGRYEKLCQPIEKDTKFVARKSIFNKHSMKKGTKIRENDLKTLRPGDGISPDKINRVIGKTLLRDIDAETKLNFDDFV